MGSPVSSETTLIELASAVDVAMLAGRGRVFLLGKG